MVRRQVKKNKKHWNHKGEISGPFHADYRTPQQRSGPTQARHCGFYSMRITDGGPVEPPNTSVGSPIDKGELRREKRPPSGKAGHWCTIAKKTVGLDLQESAPVKQEFPALQVMGALEAACSLFFSNGIEHVLEAQDGLLV